MRKLFLSLLFIYSISLSAFDGDTLIYNIRKNKNWAFYGTDHPTAQVALINERKITENFGFTCKVEKSNGKCLYEIFQSGTVSPQDSVLLSFSFKTAAPGVYAMQMYNGNRFLCSYNVVYEPEKITETYSRGDGEKRDLKYELLMLPLQRREMNPQFTLVRNKELSGREKNVYDFSMISRGNVRVTGYVAFPKGKTQLEMMVTLVPGERRSTHPLADFTANANSAEMVLYMNKRGNGEDVVKNLLVDMLLALDFAAQRPEVDGSKIFVQGTGYTAACAFVASAMSDDVAVSFVCSPDFGIFTKDFNVESVAEKVTSPVLLGVGLQEKASALQETFYLFNRKGSDKEYFVNPYGKEIGRGEWKYMRDIFILRLNDQ